MPFSERLKRFAQFILLMLLMLLRLYRTYVSTKHITLKSNTVVGSQCEGDWVNFNGLYCIIQEVELGDIMSGLMLLCLWILGLCFKTTGMKFHVRFPLTNISLAYGPRGELFHNKSHQPGLNTELGLLKFWAPLISTYFQGTWVHSTHSWSALSPKHKRAQQGKGQY